MVTRDRLSSFKGSFGERKEPRSAECNRKICFDEPMMLHLAMRLAANIQRSEQPIMYDAPCSSMDRDQSHACRLAEPSGQARTMDVAVARNSTDLGWMLQGDCASWLVREVKFKDQFNPSLDDIPLPKFAKSNTQQEEFRSNTETNKVVPNGCQVYPEGVFKVDAAIQIGQDVQRRFVRDSSSSNPSVKYTREAVHSVATLDAAVASIGTIGHPTNCAEACKYFRKAGSCKQGNLCTRCHLCKRRHLGRWRRPRGVEFCRDFGEDFGEDIGGSGNDLPNRQEVGVDTKDLEISLLQLGSSADSIGSVGHPLRCGPPCRYAWRKGGCRNGKYCYCCHSCGWSRLS